MLASNSILAIDRARLRGNLAINGSLAMGGTAFPENWPFDNVALMEARKVTSWDDEAIEREFNKFTKYHQGKSSRSSNWLRHGARGVNAA